MAKLSHGFEGQEDFNNPNVQRIKDQLGDFKFEDKELESSLGPRTSREMT